MDFDRDPDGRRQTMLRTVALAALPYEYRPLLKLLRPWQRVQGLPFPCFRHRSGCQEILLAETGMGAERAIGVLEALIGERAPDVLCSIGFAGALSGELPVGAVCLGRSFAFHGAPGGRRSDCPKLEVPLSDSMMHFGASHGWAAVGVVTTPEPCSKRSLSELYRDGIVDMESYRLARWAKERGVPFLSLRAISDGAGEEIGFDLGAISDASGRVRIGRALRAVCASPRIIGTFARLARQSSLAAHHLARAVSAFFGQSPEAIRASLDALRVRPVHPEGRETPGGAESR